MIPNKIYKIAYELQHNSSKKIKEILIAYLFYVHIIINFDTSPYKNYSIGQIANIKESKMFEFDESLITKDVKESAIKILDYNSLLINEIDFDIILKNYKNIQSKKVDPNVESSSLINSNKTSINNKSENLINHIDVSIEGQDELKRNNLQDELFSNVRTIKNIMLYFFYLSLIGIISSLIIFISYISS